MTYKIGDSLKIITDMFEGIGVYKGATILVVQECETEGQWLDRRGVEAEALNTFANGKYFELVEEEKVKTKRFTNGDKVISIKNTPEVPEGFVGYIVEDPLVDVVGRWDYAVRKEFTAAKVEYFNEDELELLSVSKQVSPDIARPVLEERKIGKVKMELFDEGFPNAIMEIARVMTWAAEHKGYKPHDWKNLPNADTEFAAAASRHKVKGFIQKVEGVDPLQRTDEESKISHLAHQAFNVLAELELVLTGVIK